MNGLRRAGGRVPRVSGRTWRRRAAVLGLFGTVCALALGAGTLIAQVRASYLYALSNFGGRLTDDWVRVHVDQDRDEIYVIYQNLIRIYTPSGMETYSFGEDLDLGQILDAVVDRDGDIFLLSYKDGRTQVTRCSFRGVPIGPLEITNLPPDLVFGANRMVYRNGLFYFASLNAASVIVTERSGAFREHVDFFRLMKVPEQRRGEVEMFGFNVDRDGNILFTVPVFFKGYRYSPDGTLESFGRPGSAPGRFGVVAGIATDSRGNVLVADKLKCVVMVFDRSFTFLTEFGYRGPRPENLIVPDDIAVDKRDHVYVTQGRRRGVSVFALTGD